MKRCRAVNNDKSANECSESSNVLPILADSEKSINESAAAEALLNLLNSAVPSNSGFDEDFLPTTSVNEEGHANRDEEIRSLCKDADNNQPTEKPSLATMTGSTQVSNIYKCCFIIK